MVANQLRGAYYLSPNPTAAFIDVSNFLGLASSINAINMTNYTANSFIYECGNNFSNLVQQFRLTGVGWRMRNQQPMQTATGRVYIAPVPDLYRPFGAQALINQTVLSTGMAAQQLLGGFGPGPINGTNILNLPGSQELSVQETVYKDVILRSKIVSDDVYTFKNANALYAQYNVGAGEANSELYTATTGVPANNSDNPDAGKIGVGWTGFFIDLEGFPAASTPTYDIEYVYAFEGTPVLGQGNDVPVPSGAAAPTGYSRDMMAKALAYVSSLPYMEFVEGAAQLGFQLYGQRTNLRQNSHRLEF
jgi:hypothetical protein